MEKDSKSVYNLGMYVIKNSSLYSIEKSSETEFLSQFALEKVEAEKLQWEKHSWKNSGKDEQDQNRLFSRSALWGGKQQIDFSARPSFKFCARSADRLYYILSMTRSHGLFYYDLKEEKEVRLFHREEFTPNGFFLDEDETILTTQTNRDGSVNLIRINSEGRKIKEITDGDCIDEHPWVSGDYLYYQTSGLARTAEGHLAARSASAIFRLGLSSGQIEAIKESHDFDYLLPKTDTQGNLYFIQRPHLAVGQSQGFLQITKDVLLFPYRLIVAIFGFLNTFSLIFGKKPLMSAGGPETPEIDLSHQIIHGQWVDTIEASRKERRQVAVGRDWKLVKRKPDGEEEVIGTNVIWYDIDAKGELLFTDGFQIFDAAGNSFFSSQQLITFIHVR